MGQAKRRGTFEQRQEAAIERNQREMVERKAIHVRQREKVWTSAILTATMMAIGGWSQYHDRTNEITGGRDCE